ncbi:hypothetical protein QA612_13730 [Evansella sp. AB-P1]|uniref:hypothetical protein n=1 Tax=Evansella sp. AB-P1 TaxID=3037653 RepID=UPI00241E534D|nr:hypothetical protein [Evansella sp. AB-P1]MDG5788542.1 hypothetical protein [Evansella sp. AB-P1]
MRKFLIMITTVMICIILLFFGGNIYESMRKMPTGNHISVATEGNYHVTLESEKEIYSLGEEIKVWGSIQYNGLKPITRVHHAKNGFFNVTISGVDNDFQHPIGSFTLRKSSFLFRNVSKLEDFHQLHSLELPVGKYEINVMAIFSEDDTHKADIKIPLILHIEVVTLDTVDK